VLHLTRPASSFLVTHSSLVRAGQVSWSFGGPEVETMRGLIVCLVLVGPVASARSAPLPKADERKDQEAAVQVVRRLGGTVQYDYQLAAPGPPYRWADARPADPEAFHPVLQVCLRDAPATDDDLRAIAKLPRLEVLLLPGTKVTGAGLVHLKDLTSLRLLDLWDTRVDDAGIKHLRQLTKLWSLGLGQTGVTDAGLAHLAGLTGLESVGLKETGVTDAGLRHLEGLTRLRAVAAQKTAVTAAGADRLRAAVPGVTVSVGR
jgi:hypothetical protein